MNGSKGLLASKTFWGGLLALVPAFDAFLSSLNVIPAGTIPDAIALLTTSVGGVLAIIGRVKASKKISSL